MADQVCLVLGGVRSGKSAFAEKLVNDRGQPTLYVATSCAGDAEMEERIQRHRQRRPAHWRTLEEPLDLAGGVAAALNDPHAAQAVLVDSLDMWASNLLLRHEAQPDAYLESLAASGLDRLLGTCRAAGAALFLVSSEVGLSMVPPYPLGRRFQDLLGLVNQQAAAAADSVYLVVAGMPVALKGSAAPKSDARILMDAQFILTSYVEQAMALAVYDKLKDRSFSGRIPSCPGVVAFGTTLRECQDQLRSTLEDWILVGLKLGHHLPVIAGIDLNQEPLREPVEPL